MHASLKSIVIAALVAATPVAALADTDVSGGFQSGAEIAAVAATGQRTAMVNVPKYSGTDVSGFQGTLDIAQHARTMATMGERGMFASSGGEDATGIQSISDIKALDGRAL